MGLLLGSNEGSGEKLKELIKVERKKVNIKKGIKSFNTYLLSFKLKKLSFWGIVKMHKKYQNIFI